MSEACRDCEHRRFGRLATTKGWASWVDCSRMTLVLFRRCALGELSGAEQRIGARVRRSRQKEAAGAADAGFVHIEWSEGEVLKLAEVGTEVEEGARTGVAAGVEGRRRCERGREVGSSACVLLFFPKWVSSSASLSSSRFGNAQEIDIERLCSGGPLRRVGSSRRTPHRVHAHGSKSPAKKRTGGEYFSRYGSAGVLE